MRGDAHCVGKGFVMTTRERVIVGITTIAVVLGGGIHVIDWMASRMSKDEASGQDVVAAEAFVSGAASTLSGVQVTEAEQLVLAGARDTWDGQPFAEAPPPVAEQRSARADPVFTYSGFIQAGERRYAIINGREYAVHDVLLDRSGVVQAIEPDHVVLRVGVDGRRQVVRLIDRLQPGERK